MIKALQVRAGEILPQPVELPPGVRFHEGHQANRHRQQQDERGDAALGFRLAPAGTGGITVGTICFTHGFAPNFENRVFPRKWPVSPREFRLAHHPLKAA